MIMESEEACEWDASIGLDFIGERNASICKEIATMATNAKNFGLGSFMIWFPLGCRILEHQSLYGKKGCDMILRIRDDFHVVEYSAYELHSSRLSYQNKKTLPILWKC
jgi:hypothetical protein